MKYLVLLFFIFSFFFFLLLPSALAAPTQLGICANNPDSATCRVASLSISSVLGSVINFAFVVAVVLALGFLVYAGIRYITSGGDKEGVASARSMIIASIVGLLIIVLSYFILNFVLIFLGIPNGLRGVNIPSLSGTSGRSGVGGTSGSGSGGNFPQSGGGTQDSSQTGGHN
jgi:Sec-independent protein secretion pathway component TatC